MRLESQVAIITGASRSIGRAIAERFAGEGAAVLLNSRTESELEETAAVIGKTGGRVAYVAGDVSEEDTVRRIVATARAQLGSVGILVNNAGIHGGIPLLTETALDVWDNLFRVNLRGAFLMMRAVLPEMVQSGRGVILNISSIAAKGAFARTAAYAASKAGLIALTRAAAAEVGRHGVRVNALCPGIVSGSGQWKEVREGMSRLLKVDEEQLATQVQSAILRGRLVQAEEVAAAALFLCSEDASAITGQAVNADGGFVYF